MLKTRESALIGHCPALLECGEYARLVKEAAKGMPYRLSSIGYSIAIAAAEIFQFLFN
jgi:hypothetical protein